VRAVISLSGSDSRERGICLGYECMVIHCNAAAASFGRLGSQEIPIFINWVFRVSFVKDRMVDMLRPSCIK
jgi:hypothetical protein